MSFEAFSNEEIQEIINHTLECMSKEALEEQIQKYGNEENLRKQLELGLSNEQAIADVFKWYGGKEKAMEAMTQSTGNTEELNQEQDKNAEIYMKFMAAKESGDINEEKEAVERLAENYKKMFKLDNARNILLDLAGEYLKYPQFAEMTDNQFGKGCSEYVAYAIQRYYGI